MDEIALHPAPEIEWPEELEHVRPKGVVGWHYWRRYTADGLESYQDVDILVMPDSTEVEFMDFSTEDPARLRHLVNQLRVALLVMEAEEAARKAWEEGDG